MAEKDTAGIDWEEMKRKFEQIKPQIEQLHVCPHCGYCPHCGRGGYGVQPYYPHNPYYPWW